MECILTVKFRGECRAIKIDEGTTFDGLGVEIRGMWDCMDITSLKLRYSVGAVNNCVLESDKDLINLLAISSAMCQKVIPVVVHSDVNFSKNHNHPTPNVVTHSFLDQCCTNGLTDLRFERVENVVTLEFINSTNLHSGSATKQSVFPYRVCKKPKLAVNPTDREIKICMPSYDICPYTDREPLLSDGWHDLFDGGIGTIFKTGAVGFRVDLIKHSTLLGFSFRYVKNTSKYIHVECICKESFDCPWHIKARCMKFCFFFEIYNGYFHHKCLGKTSLRIKSRLGPKVIGQLLHGELATHHDLSGRRIVDIMQTNYGISIPYHRGWRSAEVAKNFVFGSYYSSYDDLRWYSEAVLVINPGSVFYLEVDNKSKRFERVFVAFKACLDGFKSCRPMLFLDGTFLSGRGKGTLLTATAKDGDNGLFPVAFAVVSSENTNNWMWFLSKIRDNCVHPDELFYISDRNCGLMVAFTQLGHTTNHFFCLFHLLGNLRGRYGGGIRKGTRHRLADLFRECAYAPKKRIFDEKLLIFRQVGGRVVDEWLAQLPYEKWVVSHAPHKFHFGEMTSNAAESFNAWLKDARAKPITHMINHIRQDISCWYFDRSSASGRWTTLLCPLRHKQWLEICDLSRSWKVAQRGVSVFEVKSSPSAVVDIENRKCSCSMWEIKGFPCPHAAATIILYGSCVQEYVDPFFLTTTYQLSYSYMIYPIPQTLKYEVQSTIKFDCILPPLLKNQPGRPKKCRIKYYGKFKNTHKGKV